MDIGNHLRVCACVDLDAISHNMDQMYRHIGADTKMMAVIKADGYGHGAYPVAHALEHKEYMYGFAVATAEEAFDLRTKGIQKPLLILGYTFPYAYEELVCQSIRPAVFRKETVQLLDETVKKLKADGKIESSYKMPIHVKVDTGMSRIGISCDEEGAAFIELLGKSRELTVEGIFTHFAKADEEDKSYTKEQYQKFISFVERAEAILGYRIPIHHCANSATILTMPEYKLDMVRAGIALYGMWPSEEVKFGGLDLKPAMKLISHLTYIKNVKAGVSISYGGTFTAEHDMRIATVPVGYGDGYPRSLSGIGKVLIGQKEAPIVGRVCMDQFMVDVTDIPDCKEGDEVILIGDGLTMERLGDASGRFNYELSCDINPRVVRIYN